MLYNEFIDKKDFIIYVDKLYNSDQFIKDIVNKYIESNTSNSIISSIRILSDTKFNQLKNDILQYISDNDVLNFSESFNNDEYNILRLFISMVNSFGVGFKRTNDIFKYYIDIDDINDYKYILLNRFTSFKKLLSYDINILFIRFDNQYVHFGYNNIDISKIKLSNKLIRFIFNINSKCIDIIKNDINLDVNDIIIFKSLFEHMDIYFKENSIEYSFNISDNLIFEYSSVFDISDLTKMINNDLSKFKYKSKILYRIYEQDGKYLFEFIKKKTQE